MADTADSIHRQRARQEPAPNQSRVLGTSTPLQDQPDFDGFTAESTDDSSTGWISVGPGETHTGETATDYPPRSASKRMTDAPTKRPLYSVDQLRYCLEPEVVITRGS